MGIRRQSAPSRFEPEVVELALREAALEPRARIDTGSTMSLYVDLVAASGRVLAEKEVVEPDLVERGGRGVGRQVTANAILFLVRPRDHRGCVPADDATDPALELFVAGEKRLLVGGNRVDVIGGHHGRQADLARPGVKHDAMQEEPGAGRRRPDYLIKRLDPLLGFLRVYVRELVLEGVIHTYPLSEPSSGPLSVNLLDSPLFSVRSPCLAPLGHSGAPHRRPPLGGEPQVIGQIGQQEGST